MAVISADEFDELKLDQVVAQGSLDFQDWTKLISYVEQIHHDDIAKITLVYDSFLSEFPLCYGYWKKYAEHIRRLCNVEKAVEIFERAVESVPYSVGVWVDYCGFGVSSFEDPMDICRLFERGLSFIGKDYLCHILWDKYIEYEFSQQRWNSLADIYIRTLKFPSKKLHHYYESFKKLVTIWKEEMGYQGNSPIEEQSQHEMDSEIKASKDTELSRVISDLLDPFARSKALKKYISLGEQFYRRACDLDAKVQKFEQNIRRSYFHVKPLDDDQLQIWHQYLDLVEMEGDFDWAVKLYERCVIACANYPEFWMRYVDYVESKGGKEIATDALERATNSILKNAPEIHLFNAWYKEKEGDVGGVHAAFLQCDQDSDSHFTDIIRRKANMEKRLGNHVAASDIYKEALDLATRKRPHTLPVLYVHFARLQYAVSNSVEAARRILLDGIQHVPLSKLLLKELILFALMHEGAIKVDILDSLVENAITITSDVSHGLSTQDREELSRLYLELTDYQGTIHDVRRAWNRHLKLFPHLVRRQLFSKKPAKAGSLWKLFPRPQKPLNEDSENCLIQPPSEEEKLLMGKKIDHSEQALHAQGKFEDVNGSLEELEVGAQEATKKANCGAIDSTDRAADDRDPMDVVKESTSNGLQQVKSSSLDDESKNIIVSPASVHDIQENPSISDPVSPRDDNAAERCNESTGPSAQPSHKNSLPDISTDRPSDRDRNWHRLNLPPGKDRLDSGSPRKNSEERLERSSLSPRRRGGSREYFHDRRYRERSLSPRRYGGRRYLEDRWHRGERHDRRYYNQRHHQDNNNPRGRRDIRSQNQNQSQSQAIAVQTSNAQQQIASHQAAQLPTQAIAFPQAQIQMNQYPPPSNEQYGNMQSNPLYNQMWQYYYYNQQQQLLLRQQQQQPGQQQVPAQQLMQNTSQNPQQQSQAQQISPNNQEQQQLLLQYQQFYQQQVLQQQQPTEQPPAQQQQDQLPAQQPQVQSEGVNVVQQQQAYEYQELQKQQYLLYLQQLQLYQQQQSQQSGGLPQDQHSLQQQQQLPGVGVGQQDEQANLHHEVEKSQHQQGDGSSQVSGHYLMGRGVESTHNSTSGADALAEPPDELPEIDGTDG